MSDHKFNMILMGLISCARKNDHKCEGCPYTNKDYCVEDLATDALKIVDKYKAIRAIIQIESEK